MSVLLPVRDGSRPSKERGATLLEFALICPFFFLLVIGIIDISLYSMAAGLLDQAANEALIIARTTPDLQQNIYDVSSSDIHRTAYRNAVKRVVLAGNRILYGSGLISPPGGGGMIELESYTYGDENPADPGDRTVAVVRPYECVRVGDTSPVGCMPGDTGCIRHASLPATQPCKASVPYPLTPPKDHPLYVELRARFTPMFPFVPTIEIIGASAGYRERAPNDMTFIGSHHPVWGIPTTSSTTVTTTSSVTSTTVETVNCPPCWIEVIKESSSPAYKRGRLPLTEDPPDISGCCTRDDPQVSLDG